MAVSRARRPHEGLPATPLTENDVALLLRESGIRELGGRRPAFTDAVRLFPRWRLLVNGVYEPRSSWEPGVVPSHVR